MYVVTWISGTKERMLLCLTNEDFAKAIRGLRRNGFTPRWEAI